MAEGYDILAVASKMEPQEYDSTESTDDTGYSSRNGSTTDNNFFESDSEVFDLASGCGCLKPCPLYSFCADGCPNPTGKKVGVLKRRSLTTTAARDSFPMEEEPDLEDYERRTKDLHKSYADMNLEAYRALKRNNASIQEVGIFLQNASPLLKPRAEELNKASLEDVFRIMGDQACSWFDWEIIKDVVHRFGDPYAERCVETYETHFKKYAEQRLPKGQRSIDIGGGNKKGGKHLVVKIDREWEDVTFRDLDKLRTSFASILGVHRRDLYLADIQEGCILMAFVLPKEMTEQLFPTKSCLSSAQIESLRDEGVILLRCGKLKWRASPAKKGENGSNAAEGSKHVHEVGGIPGWKSLQDAQHLLEKGCQSTDNEQKCVQGIRYELDDSLEHSLKELKYERERRLKVLELERVHCLRELEHVRVHCLKELVHERVRRLMEFDHERKRVRRLKERIYSDNDDGADDLEPLLLKLGDRMRRKSYLYYDQGLDVIVRSSLNNQACRHILGSCNCSVTLAIDISRDEVHPRRIGTEMATTTRMLTSDNHSALHIVVNLDEIVHHDVCPEAIVLQIIATLEARLIQISATDGD